MWRGLILTLTDSLNQSLAPTLANPNPNHLVVALGGELSYPFLCPLVNLFGLEWGDGGWWLAFGQRWLVVGQQWLVVGEQWDGRGWSSGWRNEAVCILFTHKVAKLVLVFAAVCGHGGFNTLVKLDAQIPGVGWDGMGYA